MKHDMVGRSTCRYQTAALKTYKDNGNKKVDEGQEDEKEQQGVEVACSQRRVGGIRPCTTEPQSVSSNACKLERVYELFLEQTEYRQEERKTRTFINWKNMRN